MQQQLLAVVSAISEKLTTLGNESLTPTSKSLVNDIKQLNSKCVAILTKSRSSSVPQHEDKDHDSVITTVTLNGLSSVEFDEIMDEIGTHTKNESNLNVNTTIENILDSAVAAAQRLCNYENGYQSKMNETKASSKSEDQEEKEEETNVNVSEKLKMAEMNEQKQETETGAKEQQEQQEQKTEENIFKKYWKLI